MKKKNALLSAALAGLMVAGTVAGGAMAAETDAVVGVDGIGVTTDGRDAAVWTKVSYTHSDGKQAIDAAFAVQPERPNPYGGYVYQGSAKYSDPEINTDSIGYLIAGYADRVIPLSQPQGSTPKLSNLELTLGSSRIEKNTPAGEAVNITNGLLAAVVEKIADPRSPESIDGAKPLADIVPSSVNTVLDQTKAFTAVKRAAREGSLKVETVEQNGAPSAPGQTNLPGRPGMPAASTVKIVAEPGNGVGGPIAVPYAIVGIQSTPRGETEPREFRFVADEKGEVKLNGFVEGARTYEVSHLSGVSTCPMVEVRDPNNAKSSAFVLPCDQVRPVWKTIERARDGAPSKPGPRAPFAANLHKIVKDCGSPAKLVLSSLPGVEYTVDKPGATSGLVTVTAVVHSDYTLLPDAELTKTFDLGDGVIEPCDTEVVPVAPTVVPAASCGVPATLSVPTVPGVTYTVDKPEATTGIVTVTAAAESGHVFPKDAVTKWELDLGEIAPCDEAVTPVAPRLASAAACGEYGSVVPAVTPGVTYTVVAPEGSSPAGEYTVTATPNEGFVFTENAVTEWKLTVPEAEPCPTEVLATAPTIDPTLTCGEEPTVILPEIEGVEYTMTREGREVTVTAAAKAGFVLKEGSVTEWTLTIPEVKPCPTEPTVVIPVKPVLVVSEECGVDSFVELPRVEGIFYTRTVEGQTVRVVASILPGFTYPPNTVSTWTFEVPETVLCDKPVTSLAPTFLVSDKCGVETELVIPEVEGVIYTVGKPDEKGDFTVTAEAAEGYVLTEGSPIEWAVNLGSPIPCEEDPVVVPEPVDPVITDPVVTDPVVKEPAPAPAPVVAPQIVDVKKGAVTGDPLVASDNGVILWSGAALMLLLSAAGAVLLVRRKSRDSGASTL